ncbi:MAG: dihydroorotate dehydrogenase electron transfer subunit [Candidatus Zixiibacteriota bacterium]|nr:MAG: dihydroorotate dehydrogenase electron transfer subunit [candidate division Zixibacteria bacterium]
MIQEIGIVRKVKNYRPLIFSLVLELPAIAHVARPGQFVHLLVQNAPGVLLRRPFSISGVCERQVLFLIRVVGSGTTALAKLWEGAAVDVIGPLGDGFAMEGVKRAALVGGGIGAAPLLYLQDELHKQGTEVHFFLGSKTADEYPLPPEAVQFRNIVPSTDDGTYGRHGFVTQHFQEWLENDSRQGLQVYSCGPVGMMEQVARISDRYGLPHQASLENRMACGIGVCQGCAVRMKETHEHGSGFRLVCKDGPVFDAGDIDWSLIPH